MRVISVALILLLLVPSVVFAVPDPTGHNGVLDDGQSITITGTGFGSGPTISRVLYDDFESGTDGNNVPLTASGVGTWAGYNVTGAGVTSIAQAFSGTKSMALDFSGASSYRPGLDYEDASGFLEGFIVYNFILPGANVLPGCGNSDGGVNWKMIWLCETEVCGVSEPNLIFHTNTGNTTQCLFESNPPWSRLGTNEGVTVFTGGFTNTLSLTPSDGVWNRMAAYFRIAPTTEVGDNYYEETILPAGSTIQTAIATNSTTRGTTGAQDLHHVYTGYGRRCLSSSCTAYWDDVYIAVGANSRARVEIGDASTYANNTKIAMLTPTSWGATTIEGVVRGGSFISGNAYIYVTDSNGDRNATGYGPITWGQSDVTAPSTTITTGSPIATSTGSVTVEGTATDDTAVTGVKCRIGAEPDASNGTACTGTASWSCAVSGLASGENTLYCEAYDAAGNYDSGNTITANYTPPTANVTGVPFNNILWQ